MAKIWWETENLHKLETSSHKIFKNIKMKRVTLQGRHIRATISTKWSILTSLVINHINVIYHLVFLEKGPILFLCFLFLGNWFQSKMKKYYTVKLRRILQNKWSILCNSVNVTQGDKKRLSKTTDWRIMRQHLFEMWDPELNPVPEKERKDESQKIIELCSSCSYCITLISCFFF